MLALNDVTKINDCCDELRSDGRCPYLKDESRMHALRDVLLASSVDIVGAADAGQRITACSYYAARAALPHAELVVLPYQMCDVFVAIFIRCFTLFS